MKYCLLGLQRCFFGSNISKKATKAHQEVTQDIGVTTMEACSWVRGEKIGHGSYASVSKATVVDAPNTHLPTLIAVKTCEASVSDSLREEKRILDSLGACPRIVRCFGDCTTVENGKRFYNILLEFASGGTLAGEIKRKRGSGLTESDVRRHARAVLEGLSEIHAKGFVHCDIKPDNILICDCGLAKIADFGAAKEKEAMVNRGEMRGTPLYMAPESVNANEYEPPCDVWALGCVVSEMASGKKAWDEAKNTSTVSLLLRIGDSYDVPNIPKGMSKDGRDFLSKCFLKDPKARWTVQMLLSHPFVSDIPIFSLKKQLSSRNNSSFGKLGHCVQNLRELMSLRGFHSVLVKG